MSYWCVPQLYGQAGHLPYALGLGSSLEIVWLSNSMPIHIEKDLWWVFKLRKATIHLIVFSNCSLRLQVLQHSNFYRYWITLQNTGLNHPFCPLWHLRSEGPVVTPPPCHLIVSPWPYDQAFLCICSVSLRGELQFCTHLADLSEICRWNTLQ